ncbi:MAG TPA: beta-ketoacyl synthase N-terminal-like domain-containing protein [Actinocatenispora sp.]
MTDTAVAVVGMAGRFPGAHDLATYWTNLAAGTCAITDLPPDDAPAPAGLVRSGGYLDGADRFEAELFGVHPREAQVLDPQHRLLLETAWQALEDAGYDPRAAPSRTGVYVGGSPTEHHVAAAADPALAAELGTLQVRTLTDREFLAPWLSYRFGLDGPSLTVQAACATSLAAVHVATQALLLGECDTALAGGVSVASVHPHGYVHRDGDILSADGRCRPFDADADGTVPGSGVGLVVLRRLADALAAGDPVYAVLLGSAVTNDGSATLGFTAPGVDRQTAAVVEAWAAAGLSPSAAGYVEAHGTGTRLGDRVELAALTAAVTGRAPTDLPDLVGADAGAGARIGLGSVKATIGHLDAAAGVAALIKVVLMLRHRTLVPSPGVTRPRPDLDRTPFALPPATGPWPAPADGPRLAGVSGVAIGGTNVHVVLAEAPESTAPSTVDRTAQVLPISARTGAQVAAIAGALAAVLRAPDAPDLADVAYTLRAGRAALDVRAAVVAADREAAAAALTALAAGTPAPVEDPLAAAWVRGADVTWPPPAPGTRRVHLPAYPFAGEHRGALTLPTPGTAAPERPVDDGPADRTAQVLDLLSTTLGLSGPADLDRTYFAVGGDSLTAILLVGRLQDEYGLDVPVELFLEQLTIRELADRITAGGADADDPLAALLDEIESAP